MLQCYGSPDSLQSSSLLLEMIFLEGYCSGEEGLTLEIIIGESFLSLVTKKGSPKQQSSS